MSKFPCLSYTPPLVPAMKQCTTCVYISIEWKQPEGWYWRFHGGVMRFTCQWWCRFIRCLYCHRNWCQLSRGALGLVMSVVEFWSSSTFSFVCLKGIQKCVAQLSDEEKQTDRQTVDTLLLPLPRCGVLDFRITFQDKQNVQNRTKKNTKTHSRHVYLHSTFPHQIPTKPFAQLLELIAKSTATTRLLVLFLVTTRMPKHSRATTSKTIKSNSTTSKTPTSILLPVNPSNSKAKLVPVLLPASERATNE